MKPFTKAQKVKFAFDVTALGCAFYFMEPLQVVSLWIKVPAIIALFYVGHALIKRFVK